MIGTIHTVTRAGAGYVVDLDLAGARCTYGVDPSSDDASPVHTELLRRITSGELPIADPDPVAPTEAEVNRERDRRMARMTFAGRVYALTGESRRRIDAAKANAQTAILAGAQAGNLRWAFPDMDFAWIDMANATVPMDAQTMLDFGIAANAWETQHVLAARAIKDLPAIPADYAADGRWPA